MRPRDVPGDKRYIQPAFTETQGQLSFMAFNYG